jgi:hypothetical protein
MTEELLYKRPGMGSTESGARANLAVKPSSQRAPLRHRARYFVVRFRLPRVLAAPLVEEERSKRLRSWRNKNKARVARRLRKEEVKPKRSGCPSCEEAQGNRTRRERAMGEKRYFAAAVMVALFLSVGGCASATNIRRLNGDELAERWFRAFRQLRNPAFSSQRTPKSSAGSFRGSA